MDIIVLLQQAVLNHASDIFVVAGLPVSYRANGRICREKEEKLMPPQTKECVEELYKLAGGRDIRVLEEKGFRSAVIEAMKACAEVSRNL